MNRTAEQLKRHSWRQSLDRTAKQLQHLPWRRLLVISPQITILSVIAVLLFAAVIFLGLAIVRESANNQALISYYRSDIVRPFPQLQRELLGLMVLVAQPAELFDAKAIQFQRDLLESRWTIVDFAPIKAAMPPNLQEDTQEAQTRWANIKVMLDEWQSEPTNETLHEQIKQELDDLEFLINTIEVRSQQVRTKVLGPIGTYSEALLITLVIVLLLLALFLGLVAYSIFRFFRERQTAEEATRAAQAAEAAARESNRFKDQFLAVMSHELRTPLNAIIGFLGILTMRGSLDPKSAHMVQRARANADRLLLLINDILDLSKIESGRLELVPVPVSPRELATRWQYQMDVLAKQKDVRFIVEVDEKLPDYLYVDEEAVTKIGINLLSNAFKFTENGEVRLVLKALDNEWMIEVHDSGIGIPAHMHETIFESFRQVDGSSTRAYGGTGLGLSIVQLLSKAMGGTVRVQSEVGAGSTFSVTLPLQPAAEAVVQAQYA